VTGVSPGAFGSPSGFKPTFGALPASSLENGNQKGEVPLTSTFQCYVEKDASSNTNERYQSITFQSPFRNYSFEVSYI
jgi:hypothetical protein